MTWTTDNDSTQHSHLLGIAVSKFEKTADFEFGFKAIKDGIKRIQDETFAPNVLMCDAAGSIRKGVELVFGDKPTTIMMCFAHLKAAIDKNSSFKDIETNRRSKTIFPAWNMRILRKFPKLEPNCLWRSGKNMSQTSRNISLVTGLSKTTIGILGHTSVFQIPIMLWKDSMAVWKNTTHTGNAEASPSSKWRFWASWQIFRKSI